MPSLRHAWWFSLLFAASSCIGGPTSDWPTGVRDDDEDDDEKDPSIIDRDAGANQGAGSADASGGAIDGGATSPEVCRPDAGDGGESWVDVGDGGMPDAADVNVRIATDTALPDASDATSEPSPEAGTSDGCVGDP